MEDFIKMDPTDFGTIAVQTWVRENVKTPGASATISTAVVDKRPESPKEEKKEESAPEGDGSK